MSSVNTAQVYDVVVIGAGLGGLSSAARLSKEGKRVLVLEQHYVPGGYCSGFERKGFRFDVALHYLSGCTEEGYIGQALTELEMHDRVDLVPLHEKAVFEDCVIDTSTKETCKADLKREFPEESDAIDRYFEELTLIGNELQEIMTTKVKSFLEMAKYKKFLQYTRVTIKDFIDSYFTNLRLRNILYAIQMRSTPGQMVMVAAGYWLTRFDGAFAYPMGSSQGFADAFATEVVANGGEIRYRTPVGKIIMENGRVAGVITRRGEVINCDYVISNADPWRTFRDMVGDEYLDEKLRHKLDHWQASPSSFVIFLGVDMDLKELGFDGSLLMYYPTYQMEEMFTSLVNGEEVPLDSWMWIVMPSLVDPSLAPPSKTALSLGITMPYDYQEFWRREADGKRGSAYRNLKNDIADKLIRSAEKIIPGLSKKIVVKEVATPLTYERYAMNFQGAQLGWQTTPEIQKGGHLGERTCVPGLFLAGSWAQAYAGMPMAIHSGLNAAKELLAEEALLQSNA